MLNSLISDTKLSVQFLSRLPIGKASTEAPNFQSTAQAFALAGLIITLPSAFILYAASSLGLPTTVSVLLAITALVITTGGLHEDGLADTADGFGGGNDKKRKLEIMRDSSIGTYGVVALILTIGLKISLFSYLLSALGGITTALILLAIGSLSRFAILYPWASLSPARTKESTPKSAKAKDTAGLSIKYGEPDMKTFTRGALYSLPAALILVLTTGILGAILALIFGAALLVLFTRLSEKQIGGHTGDTLGATQQISEFGLLLGLAITL